MNKICINCTYHLPPSRLGWSRGVVRCALLNTIRDSRIYYSNIWQSYHWWKHVWVHVVIWFVENNVRLTEVCDKLSYVIRVQLIHFLHDLPFRSGVRLSDWYDILFYHWHVEEVFIVLCEVFGARGLWESIFRLVPWAHRNGWECHSWSTSHTLSHNSALLGVLKYI